MKKLVNSIIAFIILGLVIYFAKQSLSHSKFTNENIQFETKIPINSIQKNVSIVDELWNEIFKVSNQQSMISPDVIIKTIKFMIQEVEEDDANLIEFVKTLIHKPSDKALNLTDKHRTDFSQIGQSKYIDNLLGSKRNGFFIEAGGFDGEAHSNSLFFELEREWTGILIEPVPSNFEALKSKNRNIFAIHACIAKKRPFVAKFRVSSVLSGRFSEMSENHHKRIGNSMEIIYVPCFSLATILKAIDVSKIDYFSLDVEGGEYDVVSNLDYSKLDIKTFTIEHNGEIDRRDKIVNHLLQNKYELTKSDGQDIYLKQKE